MNEAQCFLPAQGRWELAEGVFAELEAEVLGRTPADAAQQGASPAPAHLPFALAASQTAGALRRIASMQQLITTV